MTSKNFQQSMVDQGHEIIFEVVKVSGNWAFPAAKSIVEATKGKNMYLRLTDDGRSYIFRLYSVKDGENAGETVFGFVGNGGMDLVELTATTDGTGATTGSWDYEPGEGPAGEAIGNLGKPLQWKGPATVSELNYGIEGIQPGWTYTLTDAGTLTDGSVVVDIGDEVAWTEDDEWFKVGGENSKVALFQFTGTNYPDGDAVLAEQNKGKTVVLAKYTSGPGGFWYDYYYLYRRVNGNVGAVSATYLEFYPADNSKKYIKAFKDLSAEEPEWVWTLENVKVTLATAIAPEYDPTATYPTVGTAVMYNGLRYVSNTAITTAEDWTAAHWTQTSVEDEIGNVEAKIGSVKDGGALTSAASVNVPNNAVSTLSTSEAALTLNVNLADGEVPNFAVEITAGANITLTVTKTVNNVATTLNYSAAAGNSLESGKLYQVTCVGSCWTLAEFTAPTP